MKTLFISRFFSTVALILVGSTICLAGTVTILPMKPQTGSEITVEYRPSEGDMAWTQRASSLHAVVLMVEDTDTPAKAVDVDLSADGERYRGTIVLPKGIVFALVKVGDGVNYDSNGDMFWEILVYGSDERPLPGAHYRAAMSNLGTLPSVYQKKLDQNEAMDHLTQETILYPGNKPAQINTTFLLANLKQITPEEAQARLRETIGNTTMAKNPTEALAIANAMRQMGQTDEAQSILKNAAERFPASRLPEQLDLDGLQQATSTEDFVRRAANHLDAYPNSAVRLELLDAIVNASSQSGKMGLLVDFLSRAKGVPAITYYNAVNYVGAIDSLRAASMAMIDKGFASAKDASLRPSYVGVYQWNQQQRVATSLLHFVKGAIIRTTDESAAADELAESIRIGGAETDKAAHDMYVQVLMSLQRTDEAMAAATDAIKTGVSTQGIVTTYREIAKTQGASDEEVSAQLAELQSTGRARMVERLSQEMLNQPLIDGTFKTLEGKPLKISDWKGKVVILDYWATWCGPCRKSFPALQKLYAKYKDHPNVQFAVVNVWERTETPVEKVTEFLGKNKDLTFPIFFDENDVTVAKYGVTGIPTKFYLGKDGRVQFKEVGYLPEEQFIEEATNKIEVLLAQ